MCAEHQGIEDVVRCGRLTLAQMEGASACYCHPIEYGSESRQLAAAPEQPDGAVVSGQRPTRPGHVNVEPREMTPEELAEIERTNPPNGMFSGFGEMMDPEEAIEILPMLEKTRDAKPGFPDPIAVDLTTGETTLLPPWEPDDELDAAGPAPASEARPTARTPGLGASFDGMYSSSVAPSDAEVTAGPTRLVSAANRASSGYRLHTKAGGTLATQNQTTMHGITCCCDARAIYDTTADRFFVMSVVDSCTPRIAVAMSKDSAPDNLNAGASSANDWLTWTFSLPGTNQFPDFPQIGVDADAIYLTANMFNCSTSYFVGVTMLVIPKDQLLAGSTSPTFTSWTNLTETWSGYNNQSFTVVPTVSYGDPGVGVLGELTGQGTVNDGVTTLDVNFVTLWIVRDPWSASPTLEDYPVFVQRSVINIGSVDAPQLGSSVLLETNGPELHGLTYRDGSLWICNTVRLAGPMTRVYWAEIDLLKALDPATYFGGWDQGGYIQHATRWYYYPKITADASGNAGIVMAGSQSTEYGSIYYATRASDDPADTFQEPALMKAGNTAYSFYENPSRWGDYSGIAADPADGLTFWAIGSYARASTTFGTWIGSFTMAAQTTTLPYFEDFESGGGGVTPGLWSLITGNVDGVGLSEPSGANAARLNGPDRGQDTFRTRQIDLSGAGNVEVSYYLQRGGGGDAPETSDRLTVDYVDSSGNWSNLATYTGTGSTESTFTEYTHTLPGNAKHSSFRLRFSTYSSFTGDDWFVDNLMMRDCGAADSDGDDTFDLCEECPYEPALLAPNEPGTELTCDDGVDNDCDGLTDMSDDDCAPSCICGDLDGLGGTVNLSDFNLFQICYGLRAPTGQCYQELFDCADFNQDGWINNSDFNTFQVLYGTVSTSSPPDCL